MNRTELVQQVNDSLMNYRVTWDEIKYFADMAILKINSLLGTTYPPMSEILTSTESRYCIETQGKLIPIFPDVYVQSVVVPFIITEVLAKDEEFTTIYNKFATDFDNNLYTMFQNEFNRVPKCFRQKSDVGVFINTIDTPCLQNKKSVGFLHPCVDEIKYKKDCNDLNFTFKVTYDYNLKGVAIAAQLPIDTNAYEYGASYTVMSMTNEALVSADGTKVFNFIGWYTEPDYDPSNPECLIASGTTVENIRHDVTYYAQWSQESTIDSIDGALTIIATSNIRGQITTLIVPNYINGKRITKISSNCFSNLYNLNTVVLPSTLTEIPGWSFNGFCGTEVILPEYNEVYSAPNITIKTNAFADDRDDQDTSYKLTHLYIPRSVSVIEAGAFKPIVNHNLNVILEYLQRSIPETYNLTSGHVRTTFYYGGDPNGKESL